MLHIHIITCTDLEYRMGCIHNDTLGTITRGIGCCASILCLTLHVMHNGPHFGPHVRCKYCGTPRWAVRPSLLRRAVRPRLLRRAGRLLQLHQPPAGVLRCSTSGIGFGVVFLPAVLLSTKMPLHVRMRSQLSKLSADWCFHVKEHCRPNNHKNKRDEAASLLLPCLGFDGSRVTALKVEVPESTGRTKV